MRRHIALTTSTLMFSIAVVCGCGGGSNSSSASSNASSAPPSASAGSGSSGSGSGGSGSSSSAAPGGSSGSASSGGTGSSSGSGSSSGGSGAGSGSGASSPAALAFAAQGLNQIYGVAVDSSGNVSTAPGSPNIISNAGGLYLAASGSLLFVDVRDFSSVAANSITSFRSDANGSLTKLANVPAKGAAFIAVDASGGFLYASAMADASNQGFLAPAIYGFAVDRNSGNLTSLPGSPWQINHGQTVGPLRVTPSGSYVCVNMELAKSNGDLQCYPRHADGTVDPGTNYITPAASSTGIQGFAFSANSMHVLWTDGEQNRVHSTPMDNSQNGVTIPSGGSFAYDIDVYPLSGPQWAVMDNTNSGNALTIELGGGGGSMAGNQIVAAGTAPNQLRFSSSGKYVFLTTGHGTLVYSFDSSHGTLTPLNSGNPVPGNDSLAAM